ncbi:MAG TPA: RibD family protein, partial [Verrucomicrobiae bacterium]|nr:RibD family protein [Verrucomicrobiae bacterium]
KTAMSLDGKISTVRGDSQWITGEPAREFVHRLRGQYDGIMVGINTILTDDPQLNCRLPGRKDPVRLVVDSNLRIPLTAKVLSSSSTAPLVIATTAKAPQQKKQQLEAAGARVFVYDQAQVPLREFLKDVGRLEITSILLEGGATLAWSMLEQGLIDKAHFCVAPKLIGGNCAPGPLGGPGFGELRDSMFLVDVDVAKAGSDLIITGYPRTNIQNL